jgi:hypothetical protein
LDDWELLEAPEVLSNQVISGPAAMLRHQQQIDHPPLDADARYKAQSFAGEPTKDVERRLQ